MSSTTQSSDVAETRRKKKKEDPKARNQGLVRLSSLVFLLYKELGRRLKTKRTTARNFPAVPDVENPEFKRRLDRMVEINEQIIAIWETDDIPFVKNLKTIPLIAGLASEMLLIS